MKNKIKIKKKIKNNKKIQQNQKLTRSVDLIAVWSKLTIRTKLNHLKKNEDQFELFDKYNDQKNNLTFIFYQF